MQVEKVAIIGLGLIGGSLARALKSAGFAETISGADRDTQTIEYGISEHIIDEGSLDPRDCARNAEIIVIATHLGFMKEAALAASASAPEGAVVTDTGSVKGRVIEEIGNLLPCHLSFVGGHPIAGTENSGIRNSDESLFKGKRCILTPTENTGKEALDKVASMWEAAGARVFEMDAETHDIIFGAVSHLPHVVAYSLINSVLSAENSEELIDFAGGGLRDYTRIAASSPEMWAGIFLSNRGPTIDAISRFQKALQSIKDAIDNDDQDSLIKLLSSAKSLRDKI